MFFLLGQLTLLALVNTRRKGGVIPGTVLGVLLSACVLTRYVGLALVAAAAIDLLLRQRVSTAVAAGLTFSVLVLPWVAWLTLAGTSDQVSLLALNEGSLGRRVVSQAIFYIQRLPDQLTGPVVEIGTVFQHRVLASVAVNSWAVLATVILAIGWLRALSLSRAEPLH